MKRLLLFLCCHPLGAQSGDQVEMELMTHPEIYSALHDTGKTTVLIFNGGTEQRGPQAVLGGHTFMARRTAEAIARKLGNALVAPVLPFSLAGGHLKLATPGSKQRWTPATPGSRRRWTPVSAASSGSWIASSTRSSGTQVGPGTKDGPGTRDEP